MQRTPEISGFKSFSVHKWQGGQCHAKFFLLYNDISICCPMVKSQTIVEHQTTRVNMDSVGKKHTLLDQHIEVGEGSTRLMRGRGAEAHRTTATTIFAGVVAPRRGRSCISVSCPLARPLLGDARSHHEPIAAVAAASQVGQSSLAPATFDLGNVQIRRPCAQIQPSPMRIWSSPARI
jgi:hypothetical protein